MRKILFLFGLIPFMGCSNGHFTVLYMVKWIKIQLMSNGLIIIIIIAIGLR